MKHILVVAGDPSGDLLAAKLVTALRKKEPGLHVAAVGGHRLKDVCDVFLADLVGKSSMGFTITLNQLFVLKNTLEKVIRPYLEEKKPLVIPVDYFGFNSRLACLAKSLGSQVIYYVSPQFWASRPWRVERVRNCVDMFLCLFPFETAFYEKRGLKAKFVGHPLIDHMPEVALDRPLRIEPLIGLLPGSRVHEIRRHLPIMAEVCQRISKDLPGARFVLFTVPHIDHSFYQKRINESGPTSCMIEMIQDDDYSWRSQLDASMAASGMETLENAWLGIPTVIMYKMNWPTYLIARALIQVPHIGMPNLLAGREVMPERIQHEATADTLFPILKEWLQNPARRKESRRELLSLRHPFEQGGASDRAASAIMETWA